LTDTADVAGARNVAGAGRSAEAAAAQLGATDPTTVVTVAILADDLIWATRLSDAIAAAGASPRRVRRIEDLEALLATAGDTGPTAHAIVDLTARAYDGVAAVRSAAAAGARIVAVGQHDDASLRKAALAAGAERVFTYRALFEDGPRALAAWLAR
jgi:DNA-binding NarL/FixJ family response regulator